MKLESLPNEVFHDLFEYLPIVYLLRGFHGLNSRFNNLLFVYFYAYRLDFQPMTKLDFEYICQNYLQVIRDRIISLRLSDDDDSPDQIIHFLSHITTLHHFTHLRFVSLSHIFHSQTIQKVLMKLSDLPNLTHLKIIKSEHYRNTKLLLHILNHIWTLSKLTHCHLDIYSKRQLIAIAPEMISESLKYFSIKHYLWSLNQLSVLFKHTPHLQYLDIKLDENSANQQLSSSILSMTTLKIFTTNSKDVMINLLRSMPNLYYLAVKLENIYIDGYQLEQIIVDHLPQLKNFRLQMDVSLPDEVHVDKLFDSFRTRFWLDERQWFIRCYWNTQNTNDKWSFFETHSFLSDTINLIDDGYRSKSTCPHGDNKWSYDYTHTLYYYSTALTKRSLISIRFINIRKLYIYLPFHEYLWHYVPQFDRLISLSVTISDDANDDNCYSQLQLLLDRAPRLYSLKFRSWHPSITQKLLFENTSVSIRHLDLREYSDSNNPRYFDEQDCTALIHSPLGIQCEILVIDVENRTNVMNLINTMTNLRALNVSCRNEEENTDDNLAEWLESKLPSTCRVSDKRYKRRCATRVWIR